MAELICCDRCDKTETGRVERVGVSVSQLQAGYHVTQPKPSVPGWELVKAKTNGLTFLICPRCVEALQDFFKPLAKVAPQ